jgi:hypothetical protein
MKASRVSTGSIFALIREGLTQNEDEGLEDMDGQRQSFGASEVDDESGMNVASIEVVVGDGAVFRITVERVY